MDPTTAAAVSVEGAEPSVPAAERMAAVMVRRYRRTGNCTEGDLLDAGFTLADVAEHLSEARRLARRRVVRAIEPPTPRPRTAAAAAPKAEALALPVDIRPLPAMMDRDRLGAFDASGALLFHFAASSPSRRRIEKLIALCNSAAIAAA